ncbi:MAG: MBL fold metallo-hydrolase [Desulfobacterales bacterium]|nr:MBL fold metallo-hydrolase [Desulfobacterales bacterium]
MQITCWGSRGSIPVSGKEYIRFGGDTTCIEIRAKSGEVLIIDAGTGIRRLGNKLLGEDLNAFHFIFTHAHWDHVSGFPFFRPLYFNHNKLILHRCPFHSKFVETVLSRVMSSPYFPIKFAQLDAQITFREACPDPFEIGSVRIVPVPLCHPNGGSGYKFVEDGKTFVFLTDNELGHIHPGGLSRDKYTEFAAGADLLIHDAEYTPEEYEQTVGWGHSQYSDVMDLALTAGVKKIGMFHINSERTDAAMDKIVEICRRLTGENPDMACFAVGRDMQFAL